MAGASAAAAVMTHPIAVLYVPGLFLYQAWRRRWPWIAWAGGAGLLLVVPWFGWAILIYKHPSRMLTYPIGHIMKDPGSRAELAAAWQAFIHHPVLLTLRDRLGTAEHVYGMAISGPRSEHS